MYNVSVSPHIRDKSSTQKIMIDVCIALIPTLAFGVWHFGANALIVIISSVVSCVLSELIFELIYKKPITSTTNTSYPSKSDFMSFTICTLPLDAVPCP